MGLTYLTERLGEIDRARTIEEVSDLLEQFTRDAGFRYFALAHHTDPANAPNRFLLLENYPQTWVDEYTSSGLYRHDPVRRLAGLRPGTFVWSELPARLTLSRKELDVLARAQAAGLGEGFTVSLYAHGDRQASCSFVCAPDEPLPTIALPAAEMIARHAFARLFDILHPAVLDVPRLSPRQLQCVLLMAQGHTDAQIATILGISRETVIEYINDARRRFGVTKRSQLTAAVASFGLISAQEVLGANLPI
ncbi:autoinducer binding domain-containing protein [Novosphingobium sp. PS1R-30]|uniref:Autoinducer binding domain-containing protein n=1 Tax=Novosphingobium anseongense TaxID=3133436 RepID=A0ABU8RU60_9SPHN